MSRKYKRNCEINVSKYHERCDENKTKSTILKARLNGEKEIPSNNSDAIGTFVGILSSDNSRLDYVLQTEGLTDILAAHFHNGDADEKGRVDKVIDIDRKTGVAMGSWTSTDAEKPLTLELIEQLKYGQIYVDVHTMEKPDGEIRGQVHQ